MIQVYMGNLPAVVNDEGFFPQTPISVILLSNKLVYIRNS